jgi:hypothetical protein
VDGGNGEFVFMDGSNWELVLMDGSDGQVVTLWLETGLIGSPGQSEFLAFRRNPVGRSLVGVAHNILVGGFTVRVVCDSLHLLLDLGFLAGGVVRSSVAIKQQVMVNREIFLKIHKTKQNALVNDAKKTE